MGTNVRTERDHVTLRVPAAAPSVSDVRRRLHRWMEQHEVPGERLEDARVVVSEVVANAVRHAAPLPGGDIAVEWGLDGDDLEISVTDGGSASVPHTVAAPLSAVSGRGMAIVDSLADQWWVEDQRASTTVHVRLRLWG